MKKISKEFWIKDNCLSILKCDHEYLVRAGIFSVSTHKNEEYIKKVTISYEEPEKKIEISESEFDSACDKVIKQYGVNNYFDLLKQKLFGKTE